MIDLYALFGIARSATPTQIDSAIFLHGTHSSDEMGVAARATLLDARNRRRYDEWLAHQDSLGVEAFDRALANGGFDPIVWAVPEWDVPFLGKHPTRLDPWSGALEKPVDVREAVDLAAIQLLELPRGREIADGFSLTCRTWLQRLTDRTPRVLIDPARSVDAVLATSAIRAAILPPFELDERRTHKLVAAILYSAVNQFPEGQLAIERTFADSPAGPRRATSERSFAASSVRTSLRGVNRPLITAAAGSHGALDD